MRRGGATDIIARAIAPGLGESLGQTVIVENRPGASSQIAGEAVAKAPPDGHMLLFTTQTLMTSMMIEKKSYPDFIKNFTPVTLAATGVLILVVNPSLPVKSVKELVALAVTSLKPSGAVPGMPPMAESGLPGFEVIGFWGVLAPANLPREVATRLSGEINKVLARSRYPRAFRIAGARARQHNARAVAISSRWKSEDGGN